VTDVSYASRLVRDQKFELEALPWVGDVHRFALSLTRDEADADDVVQDTYLRAFKSWHTYVPGSDCRRWLFTICRNVFLRSLERQTPTVELGSADSEAGTASALFREASDELEHLFARVDLAPALETALARVPDPFRSAVYLVDVEDQSYEAAAQMLGVPIGTVRSRLFRGRRLMQEFLLAYARDAGIGFQDLQLGSV
jgi:RNA polymerase sigma-70 factor (ECF subfamily)